MRKNIEQILHLVADYHNFCNGEDVTAQMEKNQGEMSLEELDFVAAAAGNLFGEMNMKDFLEEK